MKKWIVGILSALLAVLMAFSFIGCGGGGPEEEVDADGNTIIDMMVHVAQQSAEGMAYNRITDAFNSSDTAKENKIKIRVDYSPRSTSATGYETELGNMLNNGNLPDIITFDAPNTWNYAENGILADITDLIAEETQSDFFEISKNTYNGKLYGLPIQESSAGIYYNKAIFRSAGLLSEVENMTVDNAWTMTQFESICNRLKGKCDLPVDLQLYNANDEMATYLLYPFILAGGGTFLSSDGMTAKDYFDSAATIAAFDRLRNWVNNGYTSFDASNVGFYTGGIAMYLSSGWSIPEIRNQYTQELGNDWGILPYPKGDTGVAASATGSWSFGMTTQCATPEKAAIVLEWLVSTDSSVAITDATGMIPARRSAVERKGYTPGSPEYVLYDQLNKTGKTRPGTIAYPEFSSRFRAVINQIREGTQTTSVIVSGQAAQLQEYLGRYDR